MNALLLVGSPRKGRSASEALGGYLLEQLATHQVEIDKAYIYSARKSEEQLETLVTAVAQTDLVILAAPLYVDCLPAAVIEFLEILAQRLPEHDRLNSQRLVAISNSGFPEADQNDIALEIYRRFAQETGFDWAGGLAMGAGEAIKGRPLTESGGMARNVIAALDQAAEALAEEQAIPPQAAALMAEQMMPGWIYRTMGNLGWHLQARKYGNFGKLRQRHWKRM
jgi:hypothetical protein